MDTAIIIGSFSLISAFLFYGMNRIHNDITGISSRMDSLSSRMDGHASRIDQLYQMFVDLVKERK